MRIGIVTPMVCGTWFGITVPVTTSKKNVLKSTWTESHTFLPQRAEGFVLMIVVERVKTKGLPKRSKLKELSRIGTSSSPFSTL